MPSGRPTRRPRGWVHLVGVLGPGLITGAADDDPSGIATYASTGAEFGYGQLWTALWMLPMLIGVQEACGRIGHVTGKGLAAALRTRYPWYVVRALVILLVAANVINIGADIGGVASALRLVVPLPTALLTVAFTAAVLTLEIVMSYRRYARVLKWLSAALLAYPITVFIVAEPWTKILKATFVPNIQFSTAFFYVLTGVIGTTISPYMFFWQASQEAEEERASPARRSLRDVRIDNAIGMFFSQAVAWFIIVLTATVLNANGVTSVGSAADAARALQPLVHTFAHAGEIAEGLFALGILGLGLLAVPVLAGSAAYATGEGRGWATGLSLTPRQGRRFYAVLAAAMAIGLALNLFGVNPIQALVFAAVFNGIVAVPLIWFVGRIAANPRIMGEARSGWLSRGVIAVTFLGTGAAAVMIVLSLLPH